MQIVRRSRLAYYFERKTFWHSGLRSWRTREVTQRVVRRSVDRGSAPRFYETPNKATRQAQNVEGMVFALKGNFKTSLLSEVQACSSCTPAAALYSGKQLLHLEKLPNQ